MAAPPVIGGGSGGCQQVAGGASARAGRKRQEPVAESVPGYGAGPDSGLACPVWQGPDCVAGLGGRAAVPDSGSSTAGNPDSCSRWASDRNRTGIRRLYDSRYDARPTDALVSSPLMLLPGGRAYRPARSSGPDAAGAHPCASAERAATGPIAGPVAWRRPVAQGCPARRRGATPGTTARNETTRRPRKGSRRDADP